MAFQVSPGILVSEVDFTAATQTVSVSNAGFAGPFRWGPVLDVMDVSSEDDLVQQFAAPDDTIAQYWFSAQSFLAYSNLLKVVRVVTANALNSTALSKLLSGTVDAANGTATFTTHSASGFLTTGLVKGQSLIIGTTPYVVNSVVNTTAFTTSNVVTSGAVNAAAVSAYGLLIKNQADYDQNESSGASGYGAWAAKWPGSLGNSLKVSVCPSTNAYSNQPSGTLAWSPASNVATGSAGSTFDVDLTVGDFITSNGETIQVTAVTNSTSIQLATKPIKTSTVATGNWTRSWEFASFFDRAPNTSSFASQRGGINDEMHVVVVDAGGLFTNVPNSILERFAFVSKASNSKDSNAQNNYYVTVLNRQSLYVWWLAAPASNSNNWGSDASFTFGADVTPFNSRLNGGQSDNQDISDGDVETGYDKLADKDSVDVSLLITGPASSALASYVIQNVAEKRGDAVAFVSPNQNSVVNNPGNEEAAIISFRNGLPSSSYGFMDGNWKYAYDKYNDKFRWIPLNGDIAGLAARSEIGRASCRERV